MSEGELPLNEAMYAFILDPMRPVAVESAIRGARYNAVLVPASLRKEYFSDNNKALRAIVRQVTSRVLFFEKP